MVSSSRLPNRLERDLAAIRHLPWRQRWTLLEAFVLLPKLAVWIRLLGLRRVRALLHRLAPGSRAGVDPQSLAAARDAARLVAAAAARQPFAVSCLPRSLTLWWMLRRRGIPTELHLGVRNESGNIEAHAWLEADGVVLNDTPDVRDRYAAFDPIRWPVGAKWV